MESELSTPPEDDQSFELTPEQATSLDTAKQAAPWFNRKKVIMILCLSFVAVIGGGLLLNLGNIQKRKAAKTEGAISAGRTPSEFLRSLRDRASNRADAPVGETAVDFHSSDFQTQTLPSVSFDSPVSELTHPYAVPPAPRSAPPAPSGQITTGQASSGVDPLIAAQRSSFIPRVEGSLFSGASAGFQPAAAEQSGQSSADSYLRAVLAAQGSMPSPSFPLNPPAPVNDPYALQNNQDNKRNFYDSSSGGGAIYGGTFLGDNAIWIGSIIPGILVTAINTDLPGNVMARVTQNIYDSQTGRNLLIPQGTVLVARYNSSVSYAQHRVQIVWDTMIRPDGYHLELEGMNSVDKAGMSGQEAVYHENWFEYVKAAGIVAMFSIANSKMTETAAKYSSNTSAAAIAESSSEMINQLGGNMVSRAMNIQPTLTVENGTLINIMLNKTIYLPPLDAIQITQRYILE